MVGCSQQDDQRWQDGDFGVYANSTDCLSKEVLQLSASTGKAHLESILMALARLDTEKEAENFKELFENILQEEKECYMTLFLSCGLRLLGSRLRRTYVGWRA